jgi:hypothetical protein
MDGMQVIRKVEDGNKFHKKVKQSKGRGNAKSSKVKQSKGRRDQIASSEEDEMEDNNTDSSPVTVKQTKSKTLAAPRPIAPLPSRAKSSIRDTRASKRKRQDLSDHENDDLGVMPESGTSHIPGRRDQPVQSQNLIQPVARKHHTSSHLPVIKPAAPPRSQYSQQCANAPFCPRVPHYSSQLSDISPHLHHNPQTSHEATSLYPAQPSGIPSHPHHASQRTHKAIRIIPPRHVSHHQNEPSTSRVPHHRQLTPIIEDHDYYSQVAPHRRLPPQEYPPHQYPTSTRHGQSSLHLRQSSSHGRQSSTHIHQHHLEDTRPVHYSSRYWPGGSRGEEDYNEYHDGNEGDNPENADYEDGDYYTI